MGVKLIIKDEVNIKFEGLPLDVRKALTNKFKYEIPYARYQPAYKLGRWDGMVSLFGLGGTGFINHLEEALTVIESMGVVVDDLEDLRHPIQINFPEVTETYWADMGKVWPVGHVNEGQPIMLRDYQVEAINLFLQNTASLQEIATGAGKTITTATLAHVCEPYGRTIVIVPNTSLVEQTEEDFINVDLDVGVYYGNRKNLDKTHTICTWQSLNILDKKSKNYESSFTLAEFLDGVVAVIVDEVHMAKAEVLKNLLTQNLCNAPIRWGLTGTVPKEKFEYEQIFASIGPVVGGIKAHELQEMGVLSGCHVKVLQLIDILAFKTYHDELTYQVTNIDRMKFISQQIEQIATTGNTLVLVTRIESGTLIIDNIPDAVFVSGGVKTKDRKTEYDEIKTSSNKIIVATYGVAAVGINIPRIFNLVLLEPGKSFTRVIQSIGRGIRKAHDKDFVQIYDVTSTCKYAKRHLGDRKKFYKDAKYEFEIAKIDWN